MTLFKRNAEDILVFLGCTFVVLIDLYDIVLAAFLGSQDLQSFLRIGRSDDTVGYFCFQIGCCSRITGIAQGSPVTVG